MNEYIRTECWGKPLEEDQDSDDSGYMYRTQLCRGTGTIFFLGGGGKSVDMPSDCQILGGGGAQAYPSH